MRGAEIARALGPERRRFSAEELEPLLAALVDTAGAELAARAAAWRAVER